MYILFFYIVYKTVFYMPGDEKTNQFFKFFTKTYCDTQVHKVRLQKYYTPLDSKINLL